MSQPRVKRPLTMIGIDRPMRRRDLIALLALAVLPQRALAAEDKKKKSGGPGYIQLDTLTGATNKASGRRGVLTVGDKTAA